MCPGDLCRGDIGNVGVVWGLQGDTGVLWRCLVLGPFVTTELVQLQWQADSFMSIHTTYICIYIYISKIKGSLFGTPIISIIVYF